MRDAAMQRYYAQRAGYYDAVYEAPERAGDIAFLSAWLPERLADRKVLEIACGTGYWTRHIAPATRAMTATDGTREPLEIAQHRPGTEAVVFEQADAYALDASLGTFDGAFAGLWLSHVRREDRIRFFDGWHARLRPGSRVILIDNNEVQLGDFPIAETDAGGNTYQHRELRDGSVHRVLKNFPGEAELRALVEPVSTRVDYRMLENFWLLEYELSA